MQGNSILDVYEIDDDGDFFIDSDAVYSFIVCGDAYYPDTTETYDGVTEIIFGVWDIQHKIFALCVEGWV